jgi:hypothetical protein
MAQTKETRLYVSLKSIGWCDSKGRAVSGCDYRGKQIARPDHQLRDLVVPFIDSLIPLLGYSSNEAAKADLAALAAHIDDMQVTDLPE